jgi:hypothetical protein
MNAPGSLQVTSSGDHGVPSLATVTTRTWNHWQVFASLPQVNATSLCDRTVNATATLTACVGSVDDGIAFKIDDRTFGYHKNTLGPHIALCSSARKRGQRIHTKDIHSEASLPNLGHHTASWAH